MCECDDNPPACATSNVRKAAKNHTCFECGGTISKGDLYSYHSGVWDGEVASFKWCDNCTTIANLMRAIDPDFCFCFGGLLEAVTESLRWEAA